jgi:hypothetical protein
MPRVRKTKAIFTEMHKADGVTDALMPKSAFLAIYQNSLKLPVTFAGLQFTAYGAIWATKLTVRSLS